MHRLIAPAAFAAVFSVWGAENKSPVTNAAPSASSVTLPPVVVAASRLGRTALEMPQAVETVSREEIAASGARDVPDLVSRRTGVFVRHLGGGNPALTQLAMRGYGENSFGRVLVTVDGERLNNPDMSSPNLSRVALDAIERVEILYGPQTVLHGDGASAGLINILTETDDYARKTFLEVSGGSWNTIGTHAATRGGDAETGVRYWVSGDWKHSDGYRDRSGYDIWNVTGGVRKDWENGAFARLSFFYNDSDYELPGALTKRQWKDHPQHSANPKDWARLYAYGLTASGKGVIDDENAVKLDVTASRRKMKACYFNDYGYGYTYDENLDSDIYSYSLAPQYVNTARLGSFDNEFTAGGDFRYDTLTGHEDFTGSYVSHAKPDQSRWTVGGFARDEFFLTDELSLAGGLRLARAMARNELAAKEARNDNVSAYEAAVNWRPVETAKFFTRWTRFYRNPFLDETPWYYDKSGLYTPKEILAPERGYSVDVGGDWEFLKEWTLGGVLFAGETKNEIFYDAGKGANVNSPDKVLREGLEGHFGWAREKVAAAAIRYALTHAEFEEGSYDGERVPLVPMHQVGIDGRVYVWDAFFVRGGYRYRAKQVSGSDFANAYDRIPAYGLFTVGCQYEPQWAWAKGFVLCFDVDNLFDRNYCDYATYGSAYYPGAGRSYHVAVRYSF